MPGFALPAMLVAAGLALAAQPTSPRLDAVRARGAVGCGIEASVPGFSQVDAAGRHHGLDIDICRAIAAAVFGSAEQVTFIDVRTVAEFRANPAVDVVARRLTWELGREQPLGLLFGPITFFDGQSFLVSARQDITAARQLADHPVCVAGGTVFEAHLNEFFDTPRKVMVESPHDYRGIADALVAGQCVAYSGDVSDLAVIRSLTPRPDDYVILPDIIAREPLAPLVRDDDIQWFNIVRWTVFALIEAEHLGVTAASVDRLRSEGTSLELRRLLGAIGGNGAALGLRESWAADAIRAVGHYGEIFDRHFGPGSPVRLERGLNRLWTDGGLMYAPPLR